MKKQKNQPKVKTNLSQEELSRQIKTIAYIGRWMASSLEKNQPKTNLT